MKALNIAKISALVLAAAIAAPASANIGTGSLGTDVQSAVGSGNVHVLLKDGIATLTGQVESRVDANAAQMAALDFDGVSQVIDHLSISN